MWKILKDNFQHILPMGINQVVVDACNIKLSECKNVVNHISYYQIAFDKPTSIILEES